MGSFCGFDNTTILTGGTLLGGSLDFDGCPRILTVLPGAMINEGENFTVEVFAICH